MVEGEETLVPKFEVAHDGQREYQEYGYYVRPKLPDLYPSIHCLDEKRAIEHCRRLNSKRAQVFMAIERVLVKLVARFVLRLQQLFSLLTYPIRWTVYHYWYAPKQWARDFSWKVKVERDRILDPDSLVGFHNHDDKEIDKRKAHRVIA